VAIRYDRERIAAELAVGENVDGDEGDLHSL
jgi:hypothetical protein